MRHVTSLRWLCAVVLSSCFAMNAQAQSFDFEEAESSAEVAPTNEGGVSYSDHLSGLSETTLAETKYGEWIWTEDFSINLEGTVILLPDAGNSKTLYAGGKGFIRVSHNNGDSWKNAVTYAVTGSAPSRSFDDIAATLSDEEIITLKREFIRNEITSQYDTNFADAIDDDISDDELLIAETTEDIDIFSQYTLDIETDLMHAFDNIVIANDDAEEDDSKDSSDFLTRYLKLLDMGSDEEDAIDAIIDENSVWQMVTRKGSTWALTSEALYVTKNEGDTWEPLKIPSTMSGFISFDVSQTGERITIATKEGIIVSEDSGATWKRASGVPEDLPYKLTHTSDDLMVLATPSVVYVSADSAETLIPLTNLIVPVGEHILDVSAGEGGLLLISTESSIHATRDLVTFSDIDVSAIAGAPIRQVASLEGSESHILVRTDDCVYVLQDGTWIRQIEGLFGEVTRHIEMWPKNKDNTAILVTDSNVLVAVKDKKHLHDEGRFDLLKRQWAKEPTPERIIQQALIAHAMDDNAHEKFKTRLWTSMLLPNARFSYSKNRMATNRATTNSIGSSGAITSREWDQQRSTITEWEIYALWNFDLGKRQAEELQIEQYTHSQSRQRAALIDKVMKVIKRRYSKQMASVKGRQSNVKSEIKRILDIQELDAQLYYLTGGFFNASSYKP